MGRTGAATMSPSAALASSRTRSHLLVPTTVEEDVSVAAAPAIEERQDKRCYYDYRRSNDGIYDEECDMSDEYIEVKQPSAPAAAVSPAPSVAPTEENEENSPFPPWKKPASSKKPTKSGGDGQSHYQSLHHEAIAQGVKEHLQNIFGLGDEFFEFFDHHPTTRLTQTAEWAALEKHAKELKRRHLRDLLADEERVEALTLGEDVVFLDWSRQKVTEETMRLLMALARRMDVPQKRARMLAGEEVNNSERRPALHFALRAQTGDYPNEESSVVADAVRMSLDVRQRIWEFADSVRGERTLTPRGSRFRSVVVVGIGGSYLGPEFITSSIRKKKDDLDVRFVANVDPEAFDRETADLDPASTLVVVVSKSWSTAETLRNAEKVKSWILDAYEGDNEVSREEAVRAHFCACASRGVADKVAEWGIDSDSRLFEFWSWVGGRYSSSASAGLLPLALARGSHTARQFLKGARAVDKHFFEAPLEENVPAVMALLGVWNVNFLGLGARAVVPYAHGLSRFAAHVQQLEMESNGKSVTVDGRPLDYTTGEIVFGEPGSNAQHSFFQLLHMGQCVPCDFIGFLTPEAGQADADGHRELMANFFAQPDALALGRPFEDVVNDVLVGESDDVDLCPHRTLSGDRPSLTILLPKLDAASVGSLLALYEHRTAVQGWTWDINSWDQFGVELGKTLANDIRAHLDQQRLLLQQEGTSSSSPAGGRDQLNPSTARLLDMYSQANKQNKDDEPRHT